MARPKNLNQSTELKIPMKEGLLMALTAFAKSHEFGTANEAALHLIRAGLEVRYGEIGAAEFYKKCQDELENSEDGKALLKRRIGAFLEESAEDSDS